MKNNYNRLLCLSTATILTMNACQKDFLDTRIDNFHTPKTIITNRGTLFEFANSFYSYLPNGFNALGDNLFAAATDEAQQTAALFGGPLVFNEGLLSPFNNADEESFKRAYEGIRTANFFIDYTQNWPQLLTLNRDTIADEPNYLRDKSNIQWYRGEARIARAFYYAELIKRYGGVPLITKTLDKTDNPYVSRSPYEDIVTFIVTEIDQYKDSLQTNWRTSNFADQDGRFSLGSALALKSKVLLYAASPLHNPQNDIEKWRYAASAANDVIKLNHYALHNNYRNYFIGSATLTSNETIMAFRMASDNSLERRNYPISTPGGNSGVTPSHNLVAAYEYTGEVDPAYPYANRDPRLEASIVINGSTWNGRIIDQSIGGSDDISKANTSRTGYYLKKFLTDNLNLVQGGTAQHHWVLFRYAETLLNYAEAMNEAYGPDNDNGYGLTARQALKMVRDRASTSLPEITATSVAEFRTAIKHERRIELAFEDHRYWDLLRWKDAETALNQPILGVVSTKSESGVYGYQIRTVASRTFRAPAMYFYPFSQAEIVRSNGSLTQNPGYN